MGFYIIGGVVTMLVLLIVFLGNWENMQKRIGTVATTILALFAFTMGLLAWPLTLALIAFKFLLEKKLTAQA